MWNIPPIAAFGRRHSHIYGRRLYHCLFTEAFVMLISFICGVIFGLGLIISGMADPAKVLGFLDVTGNWDPSLAFVMAGAILVAFFAFLYAGRHKTTLLGKELKLPDASKIDRRLIWGSLLFGAGWGLAGFCPGPALVGLGMGSMKAGLFVLAMLVGMGLFELLERRRGG
jgi:uncharacterized membrane protein YedE/YeeE